MASLISMKDPLDVVRVGAWNSLELQEYYKFKFKSFIAWYTWQGVHRGLCSKVSHTHENLTKHNIKKKLYANIYRTEHIDDSVQLTHWPVGDFNEILDKSFSK